MARIRKVEIANFRGIETLEWFPSAGLNCLVGPGDSGKSTILDAIHHCLGVRRQIRFSDTDFYRLDVSNQIDISVTVADLSDSLMQLDAYGMYVRSFNPASGDIEDEPDGNTETALTINLSVNSDLEPTWTLVSERAAAQNQSRDLSWSDRIRLAPARIGISADYHLGWSRGSVLQRLSAQRPNTSSALAEAARAARITFSENSQEELQEALTTVAKTAANLGIPVGDEVKAMLDAHSVSLGGGTITLHDGYGIPLRGLGVGSTRLLIAGLQRTAAAESPIVVIDEVEHGLEPHRIIRLLDSLGAKDNNPSLQVFMTTHSPIALRELRGDQVYVVRTDTPTHEVRSVGTSDGAQSTIRLYPEAFLAISVIVCEGASEVGLLRGLDHYRTLMGEVSISALGSALVDGGGFDKLFDRASAFYGLGLRVAVVRDSDKSPSLEDQEALVTAGGKDFRWRACRTLEDELFASLSHQAIISLVDHAVEIHDAQLIDDHIKSVSSNSKSLELIKAEFSATRSVPDDSRVVLAKAAQTRKNGWFKSVSWMEDAARNIVGPDLPMADSGFKEHLDCIFQWISDTSE